MKYEISELLALRGDASIDADKFSAQAIDSRQLTNVSAYRRRRADFKR